MATKVRVAKKRRLTGGLVTITAGQGAEREAFHAHESVLQERSGFFRAALSKAWKEGQEKKIDLPDDTPDAIGAYVEWLVYGTIASSSAKAEAELTEDDIFDEFIFLAHLYVLGEKLLDDHFCDGVIKAMTEVCNTKTSTGHYCVPTRPVARVIYAGTSAQSPARTFLVDIFLQRGKKDWMFTYTDGGWYDLGEYLFDLTKAQLPETRQNRSADIPVSPQWLKLK